MFWQRFLQIASNLVAGFRQIISRKAVNYPQHPRIFYPMSAEMTVHTQVGSIMTFSCLEKACNITAGGTRWCEMATVPRPTYFLSAGYVRVSCGLCGPPASVLRWHQRASTRRLLGQSFEHAQNMSAGTCVHTCGQVRVRCVSNTDRRVLSAGNYGQQPHPLTCPQGLPGKVWQGS